MNRPSIRWVIRAITVHCELNSGEHPMLRLADETGIRIISENTRVFSLRLRTLSGQVVQPVDLPR